MFADSHSAPLQLCHSQCGLMREIYNKQYYFCFEVTADKQDTKTLNLYKNEVCKCYAYPSASTAVSGEFVVPHIDG